MGKQHRVLEAENAASSFTLTTGERHLHCSKSNDLWGGGVFNILAMDAGLGYPRDQSGYLRALESTSRGHHLSNHSANSRSLHGDLTNPTLTDRANYR